MEKCENVQKSAIPATKSCADANFFLSLHRQYPPSLSTMLKCAGHFFIYPMEKRKPYLKIYQTPAQLVDLLRSRGLTVDDADRAGQYLETISYYRLTAYLHPFLRSPKTENSYRAGVTFSRVMRLYRFDKKLRLLLFNEIEKIEVSIRAAVINECGAAFPTPFWLTEATHFKDAKAFSQTLRLVLQEMEKSKEDFIAHFRTSYSDPYPPAWMLMEILSWGAVNRALANLQNPQLKKRIARRFGLTWPVFNSWTAILVVMRNACCHHARVWNRRNALVPLVPKRLQRPWIIRAADPLRVYYDLCIVKYFLDAISPNNDMSRKVKDLLNSNPQIDPLAMGFPAGWEQEELWQ